MSATEVPFQEGYQDLAQRIRADSNLKEPSAQRFLHCIYYFLHQIPTLAKAAPKYTNQDQELILRQLSHDAKLLPDRIYNHIFIDIRELEQRKESQEWAALLYATAMMAVKRFGKWSDECVRIVELLEVENHKKEKHADHSKALEAANKLVRELE
jgi:hypothetical protein